MLLLHANSIRIRSIATQKKRKDHFGIHYVDTPVQYADIFRACKNDNLQLKNLIYLLFCSKHRLWVHVRFTEVVLTSTHKLCFRAEIRQTSLFFHKVHSGLERKYFHINHPLCLHVLISRSCGNLFICLEISFRQEHMQLLLVI